MVTDEQVRMIALFFLFSSMDEAAAIHSSQKVIAQLKAQAGSRKLSNVELLRTLKKNWETHLKTPGRKRPVSVPDHSWALPAQIEIAPWVKFQKDASADQVSAVVLSKILGFTEQEISEGFQLPIGTTRYRVSKGVRQLGAVMKATGY